MFHNSLHVIQTGVFKEVEYRYIVIYHRPDQHVHLVPEVVY